MHVHFPDTITYCATWRKSLKHSRSLHKGVITSLHKGKREVAQSCPTLHSPMDCSPPGSSIHGILQARVLEWDAIAFSDEWVYLFVKMWLMKTVQSLGYHTVVSSVVKREQLKGHHTIYKLAGRSHPDFALPNTFWVMISWWGPDPH